MKILLIVGKFVNEFKNIQFITSSIMSKIYQLIPIKSVYHKINKSINLDEFLEELNLGHYADWLNCIVYS